MHHRVAWRSPSMIKKEILFICVTEYKLERADH
jgi:hypothetical protein